MEKHDWIVGVLEDISGYAERNDLNELKRALSVAKEVISEELFVHDYSSPDDGVKNVVFLDFCRGAQS